MLGWIPLGGDSAIRLCAYSLPSALTDRNIRASAKSGSSNVSCPAFTGSSDGTCRITSIHTDRLVICWVDSGQEIARFVWYNAYDERRVGIMEGSRERESKVSAIVAKDDGMSDDKSNNCCVADLIPYCTISCGVPYNSCGVPSAAWRVQ